MPDGVTTAAIITAIAATTAATISANPSLVGGETGGAGGPAIPTAEDVRQRDIADTARRRALARGGRAATILTDDTETPLGQQIPASQIGRTTLLGG